MNPTIRNALDAIVNAIAPEPYSRKELLLELMQMPDSKPIAQAIAEIKAIDAMEDKLNFLYAMNTDKSYKQAIVDALMILNDFSEVA